MQFVKWFKNRHKGKVITTSEGKQRVGSKQTIMPVIANTGVGKSYFAIMSSILYGRPFSLDSNISYMPLANEISTKINKLNFSTFIVDESAVSMRSVSWQNKDQQKVTAYAQTERFRANWVFFLLPNYKELTTSIRDGSSEFRIFMPYRTDNHARVIVQGKSKNFRHDDAWGDKLANKMYEKAESRKKELNHEAILELERKQPFYIMDFIIPNLELILPNVCSAYNDLKIKSREQKEEIKKDFWKDEFAPRCLKVIYYDELGLKDGARITHERIAKVLGISVSQVSKLINEV
jgi:hypothetical protein